MRWSRGVALLAATVTLAACSSSTAAPAAPVKPAAAQPAAAAQPGASQPAAADQGGQACTTPQKIKLGVAVTPPNVVHTSPFVGRDLGLFAARCLDVEIVEFEGGLSATAITAVAQGQVIAGISAVPIAAGLKAHEFWGSAPRLPHAYVVAPGIQTVADLRGKRLSAAGGGVGSFNWIMGREVLKSGGLTVDDVQFVSGATAGRLPGLVSGQVHAGAFHPEDFYLAQQQMPGATSLYTLADLLPLYPFNVWGAADDLIARDRDLVRRVGAGLIEANRTIYRDKDRVLPSIVVATKKDPAAVAFAYDYLTENCVWSVNTGLSRDKTEWIIQNGIENGDIKPEQHPTFEQVVDMALADEALALAGGPTTIGKCSG
jgi:NitT/TauT family transport system substrate-binding protein